MNIMRQVEAPLPEIAHVRAFLRGLCQRFSIISSMEIRASYVVWTLLALAPIIRAVEILGLPQGVFFSLISTGVAH